MTTANNAPKYFLPAGTRLAVKDSAGRSQWYTTRSDVDVNDPQWADDPMGTGQRVLSTRYQAWTIYYQPQQARLKFAADQEAHYKNLNLHTIEYDIPTANEAMLNQDGRHGHPSSYLPRVAIRTTGSVWVIPADKIPYTMLNELYEVGATFEVTKVDVSEVGKKITQSVRAMQKRLDEAAAEAANVAARSEAALAALSADATERDRERRRQAELSRAKQLQKRYDELKSQFESAMAVFGIPTTWINRAAADVAVRAAHQNIMERVRAWAAATKAAAAAASADGAAMAAAAAADNVDPAALADFVREQGNDAVADQLQAAFGLNAPADDGTFSLVGDDNDAA